MPTYTLAQLEDRYRIDRVVLSTTLVSFMVLLFDHVLTIGDEIKYVWKRKFTVISGLFLLNRYFTLMVMTVYLAGVTSTPMTPVDGITVKVPTKIRPVEAIVVLSIVSVLISEAMLIFRVSAVYRNNKYIISYLVSLWITHLIMMVYVTMEASDYLPETHISKILFIGPSAGLIFVIPAVVFDTVVAALLTLGLYWNSGRFREQMPLLRLIMRDGTIYFFIVFASNIGWILTQTFLQKTQMGPHSVFRESDLTPIEIWSACITTTMIGRLTLNLRRFNTSNDDELTLTRLRFRTENSQQPIESEWTVEDDPRPARKATPWIVDSSERIETQINNVRVDGQ